MSQTRRLAAIVAADVAGYSRLMGISFSSARGAQSAVRRVAEPFGSRPRGPSFAMFMIAFLLFVSAFAVTQIALETEGLALEVNAPPTR